MHSTWYHSSQILHATIGDDGSSLLKSFVQMQYSLSLYPRVLEKDIGIEGFLTNVFLKSLLLGVSLSQVSSSNFNQSFSSYWIQLPFSKFLLSSSVSPFKFFKLDTFSLLSLWCRLFSLEISHRSLF